MDCVVLFSGGLDSSLMIAIAKQEGKRLLALTFDYQQRHRIEVKRAQEIAELYEIPHRVITLDTELFSGSALTDSPSLSKGRSLEEIRTGGIPTSYVPGRNTLFLANALSMAEGTGAKEIWFGANLHDKDGYPDCSPNYVRTFQALIDVGSVKKPRIVTPLIEMDKRAIWQKAIELNVPIHLTWSCYDPQEERACGSCDACVLRLSSKPQTPSQSV